MLKLVAHLLFHSVAYAVYAARDSFFYALPAAACLFAAAWLWLEGAHPAFVAAPLVAASLACTQFIVATVRKMINPHFSPKYREAMRWTRASSDLYFFIALAFAAMGALSVFLLDAAVHLYEYSTKVSAARVRQLAEGGLEKAGLRTSFIVVIFGSRTLALAALLTAVALWIRLCRIGIRIPAHVEGYYISPSEAMEITQGRGWHLLALSLIINGGISALGGALLTAVGHSFDSETPNWASAATTAAGLWVVGLLNAGYWTAIYREIASGHMHMMRREIY